MPVATSCRFHQTNELHAGRTRREHCSEADEAERSSGVPAKQESKLALNARAYRCWCSLGAESAACTSKPRPKKERQTACSWSSPCQPGVRPGHDLEPHADGYSPCFSPSPRQKAPPPPHAFVHRPTSGWSPPYFVQVAGGLDYPRHSVLETRFIQRQDPPIAGADDIPSTFWMPMDRAVRRMAATRALLQRLHRKLLVAAT